MRALPAPQLRAVAVESETDPRTVLRFVAGGPVRFASLQRIERALRRQKLGHLIPERAVFALARHEAAVKLREGAVRRRLAALAAAAQEGRPSPFAEFLAERRAAESLNPRRTDKEREA